MQRTFEFSAQTKMIRKAHKNLQDKIYYALLERGFHDFARKEMKVFNKNHRLIYEADVVGMDYDNEKDMWETTCYEIKTGFYRNAIKKAKKQAHNWYKGINGSRYNGLYSNNFVLVHSSKGIERIFDDKNYNTFGRH